MSEHIDHVAEAIRLRNQGARADYHEEQLKLFTAAQVHATLALVEQQRIANLIAMFSLSEEDASDAADLGFDYLAAAKEIREGLGL